MSDKTTAKQPSEMTIQELHAAISYYRMELNRRVLGNPMEAVVVPTCCCIAPGIVTNPACKVCNA